MEGEGGGIFGALISIAECVAEVVIVLVALKINSVFL